MPMDGLTLGFAPKEQNCANVVSILWRVFIIGGHSKLQAS